MNTDKLRTILMTVWLLLNQRYDKLGEMLEKAEWRLINPTKENTTKATDLVFYCLTCIQDVNNHRTDLANELKQAMVENENEVAFKPDSKNALALLMGLRETNSAITKLASLIPLAQQDADLLQTTGSVIERSIQEYVDELK